jgi:uncharacterized membrane protein YoaK (UPF0700 family)
LRFNTPFAVAVLLTWIAGFVDAVGFLQLGGVYTANMSGNSVSLGIHASAQEWATAFAHGWPILVYVLGLIGCRILIEAGARLRFRSIAAVALFLELLFLLPPCFYALVHPSPQDALTIAFVGLLALAMGVQNAALSHFSTLTVHTGFVTGTLLKMAEEFVKLLSWCWDTVRRDQHTFGQMLSAVSRQKSFGVSASLLVIWIFYVAGAICGTLGTHRWHTRSLMVPIAGLLLTAIVDLRSPLATQEEEEQHR